MTDMLSPEARELATQMVKVTVHEGSGTVTHVFLPDVRIQVDAANNLWVWDSEQDKVLSLFPTGKWIDVKGQAQSYQPKTA